MPSVTFDIPNGVSAKDAEAVVRAFLAAQNEPQEQGATTAQSSVEYVDDTTEPVVAYEDDEQDEQDDAVPTSNDEQRSYVSTPSGGAIPTVNMLIEAREGGLLGSKAAEREAQERDSMAESIAAYGNAAREAADDPDRKRPPRAEPNLVDAAVKMVVRLMHARTRRYIMGEGDNGGMDEQWNPEAAYEPGDRERVSDNEQGAIGFTIANVRKWLPYTMCHNYANTGWGIVELIENEYNATFTKAQVRSSIKRLTDSGFLTEAGTCGKSARYRLTDTSEWLFTKQDDNA
jgi:hypothetical protein